jgi:NIMA-interacting peptidyl-prolyl cis-trans isomerase 1
MDYKGFEREILRPIRYQVVGSCVLRGRNRTVSFTTIKKLVTRDGRNQWKRSWFWMARFLSTPAPATAAAEAPDRSKIQTTSKAATTATAAKRSTEAPAATSIPPEHQHAAKRSKQSSSGEPKEVRVLHILKSTKALVDLSSWRNPNITSTAEEAKAELQGLVEVLQEVKDNPEEMRATFEELARTESDCSSAKRGGDLGFFGRKKMQPSFEQASFGLALGEMSDVVESASGMHVILRVG